MKNNTYLENSVKSGSPDLNLTPMGLVCFVVAIMPMITWGTPINEATQQVIDFTTTAVCAVVSYAIADVFGSAGYMISTGSK